jgi:serine/threonine-protein kinase
MADGLGPGDVVGRYRVRAVLGEGGMGAVYAATRTDLPLEVALKTMLPSLRAREEAVKRFLREAEALARMRHPHVVDVVDFGVDEVHGPWFAMRLLDGESLAGRLARTGAMSPAEALAWALPVAAGLRHAHGLGVVHRDLKPDNIFLARTADGHDLPIVIDFGAARYDDGAAPLTVSGAMIGTPVYMAPEQCWGSHHATARSDQYALAFALYESVAGEAPFHADSLMEVIQRVQAGGFDPLHTRAAAVPEPFSDAVMRALAVDPARRFDDLAAFARALLPFAAAADRARWSEAFGATVDVDVDPAPPVAPTPRTVTDAPPELVPAAAAEAHTLPAQPTPAPSPPPPPPPPALRWRALLLVAAVVALAGFGWLARRGRVEEPAVPPVAVPQRAPTEAPAAPAPPPTPPRDAAPAPAVPRTRPTTRPATDAPPTPRRTAPTTPSRDGAVTPRGANGAPIRY